MFKAIIAEDNVAYRNALVNSALRDCQVDEVSTGAELVGYVRKAHMTNCPYDLILTDNNMESEESDGVNAIREIRAFDVETPIIFSTAGLDDVIEREAIAAGASVILKKPVSISELRGLVGQYCGRG